MCSQFNPALQAYVVVHLKKILRSKSWLLPKPMIYTGDLLQV